MDINAEINGYKSTVHWKNNMKTKTEQIKELKATAVKLQQQIDELEKPKQWKPTMGLDWVDRAHLSTYTRLLQYVKEFGGDWEADWKDLRQNNYYVQYSNHRKKWEVGSRCAVCVSGSVYMSSDCAQGLVAKLNTGEVVL
jgi:hypothetical protein